MNELHDGFARDDRPIVAAEFVGTSISSGGDGFDRYSGLTPAVMSDNPHLKWQNSRRGYVICRVADDAWTTEYRTVRVCDEARCACRDADEVARRTRAAGHYETLVAHSSRSATIGSTRAARDAGTMLATTATPISTSTTPAKVIGSVALTP